VRAPVTCVVLLLSAAVLSAAADDHTVFFDEDVNFATFKTFTISGGKVESARPQLKYPAVMAAIGETIRAALTKSGLKEITRGDLDVDFTVTADDYVIGPFGRVSQAPMEARGRRGVTIVGAAVDFTEATLVIDMRQSTSRELVWRGVYRDSEDDALKLADAQSKNAARLLAQYPPRKKG
jgi:hypothetical protein